MPLDLELPLAHAQFLVALRCAPFSVGLLETPLTPQFLESYPLGIQLRLPRLQLAPLGLEVQSSGLQFLAAPLELFRFHAEVFLRGARAAPHRRRC